MIISFSKKKKPKEVPPDTIFLNEFATAYVATLWKWRNQTLFKVSIYPTGQEQDRCTQWKSFCVGKSVTWPFPWGTPLLKWAILGLFQLFPFWVNMISALKISWILPMIEKKSMWFLTLETLKDKYARIFFGIFLILGAMREWRMLFKYVKIVIYSYITLGN